ncbi:hypothetical protein HELRODRAFT_160687 [Helobdella robusta]|uniref:Uncharacterized protein n=1 Tax=Helobdella robusta TaxID=6412 RepID=T1EQL6_HELRO|nr:hypothetical protein HELRODRAFT_160687 [Helobdella robusta]ESO06507.1 hypothetical protein HELRODRAFT_160687 [Helobdella robusta]
MHTLGRQDFIHYVTSDTQTTQFFWDRQSGAKVEVNIEGLNMLPTYTTATQQINYNTNYNINNNVKTYKNSVDEYSDKSTLANHVNNGLDKNTQRQKLSVDFEKNGLGLNKRSINKEHRNEDDDDDDEFSDNSFVFKDSSFFDRTEAFRKITEHFCSYPVPDYYMLTMSVAKDRTTTAKLVDCNKKITKESKKGKDVTLSQHHLLDRETVDGLRGRFDDEAGEDFCSSVHLKNQLARKYGQRGDSEYSGEVQDGLYVQRTINDPCLSKGGGNEFLSSKSNSVICQMEDTRHSLGLMFNPAQSPIRPVKKLSKDCNDAKKRCRQCMQGHDFYGENSCGRIQCLNTEDCLEAYSKECRDDEIICAQGDAYIFTLTPIFENLFSSFQCHLRLSSAYIRYKISVHIQVNLLNFSVPEFHREISYLFDEKSVKKLRMYFMRVTHEFDVMKEFMLLGKLSKSDARQRAKSSDDKKTTNLEKADEWRFTKKTIKKRRSQDSHNNEILIDSIRQSESSNFLSRRANNFHQTEDPKAAFNNFFKNPLASPAQKSIQTLKKSFDNINLVSNFRENILKSFDGNDPLAHNNHHHQQQQQLHKQQQQSHQQHLRHHHLQQFSMYQQPHQEQKQHQLLNTSDSMQSAPSKQKNRFYVFNYSANSVATYFRFNTPFFYSTSTWVRDKRKLSRLDCYKDIDHFIPLVVLKNASVMEVDDLESMRDVISRDDDVESHVYDEEGNVISSVIAGDGDDGNNDSDDDDEEKDDVDDGDGVFDDDDDDDTIGDEYQDHGKGEVDFVSRTDKHNEKELAYKGYNNNEKQQQQQQQYNLQPHVSHHHHHQQQQHGDERFKSKPHDNNTNSIVSSHNRKHLKHSKNKNIANNNKNNTNNKNSPDNTNIKTTNEGEQERDLQVVFKKAAQSNLFDYSIRPESASVIKFSIHERTSILKWWFRRQDGVELNVDSLVFNLLVTGVNKTCRIRIEVFFVIPGYPAIKNYIERGKLHIRIKLAVENVLQTDEECISG